MKPKVAFIGTGGTIASLGAGPLDLQNYGATGNVMHADEIIARWPETALVADVLPIRYRNIASTAIDFSDWKALVGLCEQLVAEHTDLAGIVIGHGTATLEETAYFLNLTLKVAVPVVLVGSQRPSSALSTDAGLNLVNAIRVAASPEARGMGVLAVLNDEIQAARDVSKTSTLRLQTFRSHDFGVLGHADGDAIAFYRRPLRRCYPETEFDIHTLDALPRVDIAYAYAGADGADVRAFIAAGAQGIVSAGFAPGFAAPGQAEALRQAVAQGITVVQSTRAGSGRTFRGKRLTDYGFLIADNLNPQKARILLALALTTTTDPDTIAQMFRTYLRRSFPMIHHVSISAHDPKHVAEVLAELMGGRAYPFPGGIASSFMAVSEDGHGTLIEVYPEDVTLVPGGSDEQQCRSGQATPGYVPFHMLLSVPIDRPTVERLGEREGWRTKYFGRGAPGQKPFFHVIEFWVENRIMIEVATPDMVAEYTQMISFAKLDAMYGNRAAA